MKRRISTPALAFCWCFLFSSTQLVQAQTGPGAQKIEQLAKQLKLTPQQKLRLAPLLEAEAPKVEAIKGNPTLGKVQKLEQLNAVHEQIDPEVKSILTPAQYQKLQEIRKKDVEQAVKKGA
jgi:Spy/CpxP family protein refolding chaperone